MEEILGQGWNGNTNHWRRPCALHLGGILQCLISWVTVDLRVMCGGGGEDSTHQYSGFQVEKGLLAKRMGLLGTWSVCKFPIVPIVLSRRHYFAIQKNQPKQSFPEVWAKDPENWLVVQTGVDEFISQIPQCFMAENDNDATSSHGFCTNFNRWDSQVRGVFSSYAERVSTCLFPAPLLGFNIIRPFFGYSIQ